MSDITCHQGKATKTTKREHGGLPLRWEQPRTPAALGVLLGITMAGHCAKLFSPFLAKLNAG